MIGSRLERSAASIYFEVTGKGPALVFAHGLGGNHMSWWQQVPYWAARYTCVTFAHRGFAPSHGENPDPAEFAGDLAALLDYLGIGEAALIAQSMGGWTCLDFAMRYPLIDGQGNFGSIAGLPPAAMRYTEARLSRIATALLEDIDKETVDFRPNYDESEFEPEVLPTRVPNLLVNGSSGIAVGMATNIPPHNLSEIIEATILLIRHPETPLEKIMEIVKGPDFPTGGYILGRQGILDAFRTGRGSLKIRAKARIEPMGKGDREHIVVEEIPYQVNKSRLIETAAALVNDKGEPRLIPVTRQYGHTACEKRHKCPSS